MLQTGFREMSNADLMVSEVFLVVRKPCRKARAEREVDNTLQSAEYGILRWENM